VAYCGLFVNNSPISSLLHNDSSSVQELLPPATMRARVIVRWLRWRRFRSRDLLIGVALVTVMLLLTPALFRVQLSGNDVIDE